MMEIKKLSISQSLQKDFLDYQNKEFCGILFDAKWISRTVTIPPSESMMMGRWFEYLALGPYKEGMGSYFGLNHGDIPGGMKAAGKKNVEIWDINLETPWMLTPSGDPLIQDADIEAHWTSKYYYLWIQAKHFRSTVEAYGIDILEVQKRFVTDLGNWQRTMVWDVYAKVNDMPDPDNKGKSFPPHYAIIDTKATGLINDKWQPYGWDISKLIHKDKILIQPIDYLDQCRYDGIPQVDQFYFFVHSNTNQVDRKIVKTTVHDSLLDRHRDEVQKMAETIDFLRFKGFTPYPDITWCEECPLKETCEYRAFHPKVRVINIL